MNANAALESKPANPAFDAVAEAFINLELTTEEFLAASLDDDNPCVIRTGSP